MVNSLIKLKLLNLTIVGAILGSIATVAVASVVTKELCKKKKTSEENQS